LIYYW